MINIATLEKNEKFLQNIDRFDSKIRGVAPLIGGSPRLVLLFYELISRDDFENIESTVFKIIDEHTPYYQEIIQQFSGQKKKIFDTLLIAPTPLTPKEIAQKTRIDIGVVNTQLRRLEKERHVISRSIKKHTSYSVREQLFRFWREMRQPFGRHRVSLFIEFLKLYYTTKERRERFKFKFDLLVAGDKTVVKDVCYYIETLPVKCKFEFLPKITEKINELGSYDKVAQHIQKIEFDLAEYENKFIKEAINQFEKERYEDALTSLNKCLNLDSKNREASKLKAKILEKQGRINEAFEILNNLIIEKPDDADSLKIKGRFLLQKGKLDEALIFLKKSLDYVPDDYETLFYKVSILIELNRFDDANEIINDLLNKDPKRDTTLLLQGIFLTKTDKNDEAYAVFNNLLQMNPENIYLKKFIASILENLGKNDEVLAIYDSILSQNPNDIESQLLKSNFLKNIGRIDEIFVVIDQILKYDPNNEEAIILKASIFADQNQYTKIIEICEDYLKHNPNHERVLQYFGWALCQLAQFDEAIVIVNKLLEIKPNEIEYLIQKGQILRDIGRNEESLNIFNKILSIDPKQEDALFHKGLTLCHLGKTDDALELFNKIIENNPKNENAFLGKISIYRKLNQHENGLKFINEILEINPSESFVLYCKAGLLFDLSRYDEALTIVNDLIKTDPSDSLYRLKAGILSQQKNHEEAINIINFTIQTYPYSEESKLDKAKILFNSKRYEENIKYIDENYNKNLSKEIAIKLKLILINSYIRLKKNSNAIVEIEKFIEHFSNEPPKLVEELFDHMLKLALMELISGNLKSGKKLMNQVFLNPNLNETQLKTYAIDFMNDAIDTSNYSVISTILEELTKIDGPDFKILLKPFSDALFIINEKKTSYYYSNLQIEEREIVSEIVKRITNSDELQLPK
jgi:hypothetical protein